MAAAASKVSDDLNDRAPFKQRGLAPHFSKLAFVECPDVLKLIDWDAVSNELAPLVREDMGLIDLEPPSK